MAALTAPVDNVPEGPSVDVVTVMSSACRLKQMASDVALSVDALSVTASDVLDAWVAYVAPESPEAWCEAEPSFRDLAAVPLFIRVVRDEGDSFTVSFLIPSTAERLCKLMRTMLEELRDAGELGSVGNGVTVWRNDVPIANAMLEDGADG